MLTLRHEKCFQIIKNTSRKFVWEPEKTGENPPDVFGRPHHDLSTGLLQHHQLQTDQVVQLSQVRICLCSLGNYGKYYCSLLLLHCALLLVPLSLDKWPKLIHTEWDQLGKKEGDPSGTRWFGPDHLNNVVVQSRTIRSMYCSTDLIIQSKIYILKAPPQVSVSLYSLSLGFLPPSLLILPIRRGK